MKNKKAFRIGLLSTVVVGMAIAITAVSINHEKLFMGRGVLHDGSCEWNHYTEVEATYESHGSKEFWACCTHPGEMVLEAPAEGTITDKGPLSGEYFDSLPSEDPRFIPMLEGGNKYAQLDVIGWQDPALLYSVNQYTDVQTVTMKVRVIGEYNSWFGVNVRSDHNDWEGIKNFTTGLDGEWHVVTSDIGGLSGYVNFCYNLDHVQEGHIDVDDITIVTSDGVFFEDFENNSLFTLDANHARIAQVAPGNKFLREDSINIDNEQVLVYTAKQYTGVTNVSYKVRVPSGCGSWGGVAVASDLSIYNNTNVKYTADGTWHTISQDFAGVDGYVEFCHEQGHFTGPLDIDDVVITYDGGKLAYEGFDGESIFRVRKPELAKLVLGEPGKAIGVTALDAATTSVENREYSPIFTASKGIDAEYGSYVQIDDWACRSDQNRCWIGFTQTETLSLIKARLGAEIDYYYLYVYNPLDEDFGLQIMFEHDYTNIAGVTLTSHAWTRIEMTLRAYGSDVLTEAHQLGFDHPFFGEDGNGHVVGSGFKFTSIYASPKSSTPVNPAPFGVVALDAQTGGMRDTKGYNAPNNQSHGIDAEYGAYIQIDNWSCPSGGSRCWLTYSDTATSVFDLEVALGGEVVSYFFYIYNPLDTAFTFNLMLKSSSGTGRSVSCAPHAWTLAEMPFNLADGGSYPALTLASQIGVDHTFGSNGAEVGSGWKFTSVYARTNTNYFARLHADTYSSSKAPLYSTATYENITSVAFDYRLTGGPKATGGWWGIGIAEGHGLYDGMHTGYTPDMWDGQWHSKTITLASPESGYVNIIHACGELVDGSTIDIDNIVITYNDGTTVTESFMNGYNYFEVYASHPEAVELIAQ